jgi:polyferredoxin
MQVGALICFGLFIYFGWGQPIFKMDSAAELLYRRLNFTTFVVWGLWWTSMIWIAFLIGRAWCQVCPLELIMNISERLGRRLGISQKLLPKIFHQGMLIVIGYLIVQLAVASYHIYRVPQGAAIF